VSAKKPSYREATRRRSITEREVFDIIDTEIQASKKEKLPAECVRYSAHWFEHSGRIKALVSLKRDMRAAISRDRKP